jgi:hypothetical protein
MHADHLVRSLCGRRDFRDGDRRSIGGEDDILPRIRIHILENPELQLRVFRGGLDDKVSLWHRVHIPDIIDPVCRCFLFRIEQAFLQELGCGFGNRRPGFLQRGGHHVHAGDLVTRGRRDLRDAVAHGPRADDEDVFDGHVFLLRARLKLPRCLTGSVTRIIRVDLSRSYSCS